MDGKNMIKGTGVSPGISIGIAHILKKDDDGLSGIIIQTNEARELEIEKFNQAVVSAIREVETIRLNTSFDLKPEDMDILDTQVEFLGDPQIAEDVHEKIRNHFRSAHDAVIEVIDAAVEMFRNMDDEYLSARAADLRDIGNRILRNLNTGRASFGPDFGENTILIADDLAPSDTITLDTTRVVGFATRLGGRTSHTAIIAKAKGIPAVVACGSELLNIRIGETVILDGTTGELIINPGSEIMGVYKAKQVNILNEKALLRSLKDLPAITTDGHRLKLYANISNAAELEQVFENGGEGVGLLRTEMLFMGRDSFPSEEEQFNFYKQVAIKSKNRPVIIRTLDIGGDKQLPYFGIPPENNPFMGYRAIRICLDQPEIFFTQLRAILRASVFGNLKIMFPMISNLSEVKQAKESVNEVKLELKNAGIDFDRSIELGIMIEIPSAALIADILAREVDFFSIGTNDLCQYTLAVDRMNGKVSALYNHFNPGVLRLISYVIEQAHKQNKPVGLCGEMASDPLAALLLSGMGLDEFSMSAGSIPSIKNILIKNSLSKAREVFKTVMEMDDPQTIINYLKEDIK